MTTDAQTDPVAVAIEKAMRLRWSLRDDGRLHHEVCPGVPAVRCECAGEIEEDRRALQRIALVAMKEEVLCSVLWGGRACRVRALSVHQWCHGCHRQMEIGAELAALEGA